MIAISHAASRERCPWIRPAEAQRRCTALCSGPRMSVRPALVPEPRLKALYRPALWPAMAAEIDTIPGLPVDSPLGASQERDDMLSRSRDQPGTKRHRCQIARRAQLVLALRRQRASASARAAAVYRTRTMPLEQGVTAVTLAAAGALSGEHHLPSQRSGRNLPHFGEHDDHPLSCGQVVRTIGLIP